MPFDGAITPFNLLTARAALAQARATGAPCAILLGQSVPESYAAQEATAAALAAQLCVARVFHARRVWRTAGGHEHVSPPFFVIGLADDEDVRAALRREHFGVGQNHPTVRLWLRRMA